MSCLLRVTAPGPLTRFLDPTGDDYVPCICNGTAQAVTCEVYPYLPATQAIASTAMLSINGAAKSFDNVTSTASCVQLTFTIGNDSVNESAPNWNAITITIQDNAGAFTAFTFWFYKAAGGANTTTTTPMPTGTPAPSTTRMFAAGRRAPTRASAKKKR
jgi:hypothetical protein